MGVKHLWQILSPICEKKTLYDLQDEVIAVDLSCWVCENQALNDNYNISQPRMYLRNLFFRTTQLLLLNIKPIFVLEGEPIELKHDQIRLRNDARYKGKKLSKNKNVTRKRFYSTLIQCQKFLDMLGLKCVQSEHEAEAMCALLNEQQIVSGVISQDSDTFLYGAQKVYRNLTIQGPGSVEVYKMSNIENKLNLTREKLVVMSLLCGCDYDAAGVEGIGKETAFKFIQSIDGDVIARIRNWKENENLNYYEAQRNKNYCKRCQHLGKLLEHKKHGCPLCRTDKECKENTPEVTDDQQKLLSLEANIRKKSLTTPNFPNEDIISEYLEHTEDITDIDIEWHQPDILKFVKFTERMLDWEVNYSIEKVLPLLTRWCLVYNNFKVIKPVQVLKKKKKQGVECYEVLWEIVDVKIQNILQEDLDKVNLSTVEPRVLVNEKCPWLVEDCLKTKPKKKPRKVKECLSRATSMPNIDELSVALDRGCTISSKSEFEVLFDDCVSDDEVDLSFVIDSIVSRNNFM